MQTVQYIILILTFVYLWVDEVAPSRPIDQALLRLTLWNKNIGWFTTKLLTCEVCLSWWAGVILYINTGELWYLTAPLFMKLIYKHLI